MVANVRQGVRPWKCNAVTVGMSRTAEVASSCLPGQKYALYVQRAITGLANRGEGSVFTVRNLPVHIPVMVVPNDGQTPFWGIHVGHKARTPRFSPFVEVRGTPGTTTSLTIEVVGIPKEPLLVRAHPGEYIPPLPWQVSAGNADGGVEACEEYWSGHSFVYAPNLITGPRVDGVPDWYHR